MCFSSFSFFYFTDDDFRGSPFSRGAIVVGVKANEAAASQIIDPETCFFLGCYFLYSRARNGMREIRWRSMIGRSVIAVFQDTFWVGEFVTFFIEINLKYNEKILDGIMVEAGKKAPSP